MKWSLIESLNDLDFLVYTNFLEIHCSFYYLHFNLCEIKRIQNMRIKSTLCSMFNNSKYFQNFGEIIVKKLLSHIVIPSHKIEQKINKD